MPTKGGCETIRSSCCPKTSWHTTNATLIGGPSCCAWHTCLIAPCVSCTNNGRILLANLLQSSRSTFSRGSFFNFFAFKEGMFDTQISALGGWPTVSGRLSGLVGSAPGAANPYHTALSWITDEQRRSARPVRSSSSRSTEGTSFRQGFIYTCRISFLRSTGTLTAGAWTSIPCAGSVCQCQRSSLNSRSSRYGRSFLTTGV
jgi:hypothetical protein